MKTYLRAVGLVVAGLALVSCGWGDGGNFTKETPADAQNCATPAAGCSCSLVGEELDCGSTMGRSGDLVQCLRGTMRCTEEGVYSACSSDRVTYVDASSPGRDLTALGNPTLCPSGFDPCDPYCNYTVDGPGGFNAGTGFSNDPATGLTLYGTYTPICTSLTLTPSTNTVTLQGSSMGTLSAPPVTFTLNAVPAGCLTSPFATTWTVDRFDRATITGSTNTDGQLTVAVPIAGTIKVTAFAGAKSVSTNIAVKVNVLEAPGTDVLASPNFAATASQISAFGTIGSPNPGTTATTATWLYPYAGTYLPLALPAPILQYRYTRSGSDSTSNPSAVKVSIRYPKNSTVATSTFNYSIVLEEANSVSCAAKPAWCNFLDPQVTIPKAAWNYFEQTARGQDADLIIQRLRVQSSGSPILENESARTIRFVDGQLKGTVFYHSYTSPLAGNTGAILSIQPGAASPTLAVAPGGTCSTCHSINNNGQRLITNGGKNSGGSYSYDISVRYDMTTPGPSPTALDSYTNNRFSFGGPWLDGQYYMTHGAGTEWHAPSGASGFYNVNNENTPVSVANFPNDVQGYSPRFSPDGTDVAFTFRGGTSLPCSSNAISPCSGSPKKLASVSGMTRMVVMDFTCSSPPCTSSSTGFSVSNARDVSPGVTDRVAWPTLSPDNKQIAYQRQIRSSKSILSWAASDVGTIAGAQAEIWASNIPTDGSTAASPVRMNQLNGLTAGGASYLPQRARTVIDNANPLYTFRINRFDMNVTSGSAGPTVFLSGATTSAYDVRIDIINGGAVGTATFQYSTNGGSSWSSTQTTGATVNLTAGLKANFSSGTYNSTSIYKARTGQVTLTGTPQTTNQDVRIRIVGTGNLGVATFQYSTDGGSSWSGTLTTAATVALGATGLVAGFGNINYESTSWAWGALVTHPHEDGAQYTLVQADSCSNNATMSSTYDYQTNYYPSFAPQKVGGLSWVLFTSRRMYGNIATQDGWDPEPNMGCTSGRTPAKKLWIAAVNPDAAAGTDPSYPAFYLPGQEIAAGNSEGYWVGTACTAVDGACETDDDCCGGTGVGATNQCKVISTASFPPGKACKARAQCSAEGQSCTATADCCSGLKCPAGGGLCYQEPPLLFEVQTFVRTYEASCPKGTLPAWRFFEWQATIPTGTSIEFYAQTREVDADPWSPPVALSIGTATVSTGSTNWFRGPLPVSSVLKNASLLSRAKLAVTMVFKPTSNGQVAPTLLNWRQIFDCVPGE